MLASLLTVFFFCEPGGRRRRREEEGGGRRKTSHPNKFGTKYGIIPSTEPRKARFHSWFNTMVPYERAYRPRSCLDGRLKNCYNQQQQQHSRESGPCSTLLPYRYEYNIIPEQGPYLPDKSSSKIKEEEGATNTPPLLLLASLSFFIVLLL